MKKIFTLVFLAAASAVYAEEYATPGTGAAITPATLATVEASGVTAQGDGTTRSLPTSLSPRPTSSPSATPKPCSSATACA